jgi:hypothetical protein
MKHHKIVPLLALLLATVSWAGAAVAQDAHATAVRPLQLSAFAAATGNFTGLAGGKNFSITAGGDLGLPPWHGVRPTIEIRGTYPLDHGLVDSQKSVLGGLRVDFLLNHRLRPYADYLYGRGQINYGLGYIYNGYVYALTTTYVNSPGIGFNYILSDHLEFKLDAQAQRWASTPTSAGVIYSSLGSAGLVYNFNFEPRHRR